MKEPIKKMNREAADRERKNLQTTSGKGIISRIREELLIYSRKKSNEIIQLFHGQVIGKDISMKRVYRWQTNRWKEVTVAQHRERHEARRDTSSSGRDLSERPKLTNRDYTSRRG